MYLLDTNIISELRKKGKANTGVSSFFNKTSLEKTPLFISVITVGELRRGIEMIRHRGDKIQAETLEKWLEIVLSDYSENILDFGQTEAQVWGRLRVPHHENSLDKQIAATALTYGLCVVTRNVDDFSGTGVEVFNPFE